MRCSADIWVKANQSIFNLGLGFYNSVFCFICWQSRVFKAIFEHNAPCTQSVFRIQGSELEATSEFGYRVELPAMEKAKEGSLRWNAEELEHKGPKIPSLHSFAIFGV